MSAAFCGLWSTVPLPLSCVCLGDLCIWCHSSCNSWWGHWSEPSGPLLTTSSFFCSSSLSSLSGQVTWNVTHSFCYRISLFHGGPNDWFFISGNVILRADNCHTMLGRTVSQDSGLAWPVKLCNLLCNPSLCARSCILLHFIYLHFFQ